MLRQGCARRVTYKTEDRQRKMQIEWKKRTIQLTLYGAGQVFFAFIPSLSFQFSRLRFYPSLSVVVFAAFFCFSAGAQAAAKSWLGNTDANFNTAANWTTATFNSGDSMTFTNAGSSGATLSNDLDALTTVAGITFLASAPAYILNGNSITLNGNITAAASLVDQIINLPMTLSVTPSIATRNSTTALTLGGVIDGTGGLTKGNNLGTLILSGNNTYSGTLTIQRGTLSVAYLGDAVNGAGTISIGSASAGGLTYTGSENVTLARAVNLAGAASGVTLDVSGTGNLAFNTAFTATGSGAKTLTLQGSSSGAGTISVDIVDSAGGATAVTKTGTGIWTLSGARTYSGLTSIIGGALLLQGSNNSAGATTLNSATAVLQFDSASNGGLAGGLLTLAAGKLEALTTGRSITNAATLTAATVQGSQDLSFNGKLTGYAGANRTLTSSIAGGKTLTLSDVDINTDVTPNRTLTIAGTGNTAITGTIANGNGTSTNSLTINSTGILTLSGSNTYSGATTLTAGILNINNGGDATHSAIGTGALIINGGAIDNTSGEAIILGSGNVVTLGVDLVYGGTQDLNLGTGATALTQANTPGRTITLNGTGRTFTVGAVTGSSVTAPVNTVNGSNNTLVLGSLALNLSATARVCTWGGSANVTVNGGISGGGNAAHAFTYAGTGIFTISGACTYTGVTTVNSGTVLVNGSLDAGSAVVVGGVGTLGGVGTINGTVSVSLGGNLAPGGGTIGTLALSNNSASALTLNGSTMIFGLNSAATPGATYDNIAITGSLVLSGTNYIILTSPVGSIATGTYTLMTYAGRSGSGSLTFENGSTNMTVGVSTLMIAVGATSVTLNVTGASASLTALRWRGNISGTWDTTSSNWVNDLVATKYSGGNYVTFDDTASGNFTVSGATMSPGSATINNNSSIYAISAIIAGTGPVLKTGTNILTLSGANTYTGVTTIKAGILNAGVADGAGTGALGNGGNITFSGGTLQYSANSAGIDWGARIKNSTAPVILDSNGQTVTLASIIDSSNTNGLTKLGTGTLTLSCSNAYRGATTLSAGQLNINHASALSTGMFAINGGMLDNTGAGAISNACNNVINIGGNFTFAGSRDLNLGTNTVSLSAGTTIITNNGSGILTVGIVSMSAKILRKRGTGTLKVAGGFYGSSSFDVYLEEGELILGQLPSGYTVNEKLHIANGTVLDVADSCVINNSGQPFTIDGSFTFVGSGALTMSPGGTGFTLTDNSIITVNANTLTLGNAIAGAYGITKAGAGSLILSAVNTYSGATAVNNGVLNMAGSATNSDVTFSSGATLVGAGAVASLTLDSANLRVDTAAGAMTATNNPGTGNLTLTGTTTVYLDGAPVTVTNAICVLGYFGTLTGGAANLSLANAANYRSASFSTTASKVNLDIGMKALTWSGATAAWDVGTSLNWNSGADKYYEGDIVTFTAAGTTKSVTLNTTVHPGAVNFNNTAGNDYTLSGSGGIAGACGLTKSSTGTLTLSGANSYSGATTVYGGGTLTISGSGAITGGGALTLGLTSSIGIFQYYSSAASTFGSIALGSGGSSPGGCLSLVQTNGTINGSSLDLGVNASSYVYGALWISGGTMNISGATALHVSPSLVNGVTNSITVSGTGVFNADGGLCLSAYSSAARSSNNKFIQNGGTVTVAGAGGLQLMNAGVSNTITPRLAKYDFNGGTLNVNVITNGSTSAFDALGTFVFNGGTLKPTASSATFWVNSACTIASITNGGAIIDTAGYNITIEQPLLHAAGATNDFLLKLGAGVLTLSGSNTYNGVTIISNGVLRLTDASCLSTNTDVYIWSGCTNDLAFAGTNTIRTLYINGVAQVAGVHGMDTESMAGYITGAGYLKSMVGSIPQGSYYIFY